MVLIAVSACEKLENKSELKISANPESVEYMGTVYLSWGSKNVTECKLNGNIVESSGLIEIKGLARDTIFILTGKNLSGEVLSSKAEIKVGAKTRYYDYLDTLCSGRWVLVQRRILGIPIWDTEPNEWYYQNTDNIGDWSDGVFFDENPFSTIFSKDSKYNQLIYKKYDTYYLMDWAYGFELSKDLKSLKFNGDQAVIGQDLPYEISHISSDSLVLYKKNQRITFAGSFGSGHGYFPTYSKYVHIKDLEMKIESNDTTSSYFKLLSSGPWKLDKIKFYSDDKYMYDEPLSDIVKKINYYFSKDGDFEGYENNTLLEGGTKWYLIDNNTKIWRTGFVPSYIMKIIKLESNSLILSRSLRSINTDPEGNWHSSTQEFYYVR